MTIDAEIFGWCMVGALLVAGLVLGWATATAWHTMQVGSIDELVEDIKKSRSQNSGVSGQKGKRL